MKRVFSLTIAVSIALLSLAFFGAAAVMLANVPNGKPDAVIDLATVEGVNWVKGQ